MTRTLVANNLFNPPQLLINSGFDFWQRSITSVATTGTPQYVSVDRWQLEAGGSGTANVVRSTDLPGSQWGSYSTVFTQVGSGSTSHRMWQRIEASIIAPYVGQTLTISFWAKVSAVNGNTAFQTIVAVPASVDTWPSENTSASQIFGTSELSTAFTAGVWKRFSYTFTVPATAANGLCIGILGISDTAGHVWSFAAPMLSPIGAPDRLIRSAGTIQQELALCQRYYEKSYNIDVAPGTATTGGIIDISWGQNQPAGISLFGAIRYKVEKRTAASINYLTRAGGSGIQRYSNSSSLQDTVAGTSNGNATSGFIVNAGNTVGTSIGYIDFHYTADAEL